MARPTKQPDELRSKEARARLTLAEREYVRQQAQIAGLEVSEYIRRRILDYEVPSGARRRADPALVSELNRLGLEISAIGNNANQIALAGWTDRRIPLAWEAVRDRIYELGAQVEASLEQILGDD